MKRFIAILTVLSSTMVYAEVFYMLNTPEKYRGKTVRLEDGAQYATLPDARIE